MATLAPVFTELRKIMAPYGAKLEIKRDAPGDFYVDTRHLGANKTPIFFGAVQEKAKFVSYHLMPVYSHPELLEGISPEVKARMQGKSCFNFNEVATALMKQLAALTKRSFERYKKVGYV
ncbi:MAG TPA: hypothetical protein VGE76_24315 [Opitutaceae bacterium]